MAGIVVVGSVNADLILRMDRLPRPGETVLGREYSMALGGKGANQAVAARRAGAGVSLIGRVGDDPFGREALESLNREGIDTRLLRAESPGTTGVALIFVDAQGENSIGVASGANASLGSRDIAYARAAIAAADMLLVQLETPMDAVIAAINVAYESGVPVLLNPAPAQMLPDAVWEKISVFTPNSGEAEALSGIRVADVKGARAAAHVFHERGVKTVFITLGEDGVFVSAAGDSFHLTAHPVKVIDTTAAGDVFSGALAVGLVEDRPLREAAQFANAAAALCVSQPGAQPSIPRRSEIESFLRRSLFEGTGKS